MLSYKELEKKRRFIADNSIKCECGHSMFFVKDYHICSWCGRKVYKDDKTKFKYELIKKIRRKSMIKVTCDKCGKEIPEENQCGYYNECFDLCEDCEKEFIDTENKIVEFAQKEREKVEEKIRKIYIVVKQI